MYSSLKTGYEFNYSIIKAKVARQTQFVNKTSYWNERIRLNSRKAYHESTKLKSLYVIAEKKTKKWSKLSQSSINYWCGSTIKSNNAVFLVLHRSPLSFHFNLIHTSHSTLLSTQLQSLRDINFIPRTGTVEVTVQYRQRRMLCAFLLGGIHRCTAVYSGL